MNSLAIPPAQRDALARWLDHLRALDAAAANTLTAYAHDVTGFLAFLALHHGESEGLKAIAKVDQSDLRAWMAHERERKLSSRSLARELSAVKNFVAWVADRENIDATAVLSARGPKFRRKLPRPLTVDGAREMISQVGEQAREDWIAARDIAVLTLLYGCGLRISEALNLTGAAHPLPDTLRILGKGGKERLVPTLPITRDAVADYGRLCPYDFFVDDGVAADGVAGGQHEAVAVVLDLRPHQARRVDQCRMVVEVEALLALGDRRFIADRGRAALEQGVHQRRFADVGNAHDHACAAA